MWRHVTINDSPAGRCWPAVGKVAATTFPTAST
jgi:hypothetical protein